jgi:tetratricopeptide (TPR) repeat protein
VPSGPGRRRPGAVRIAAVLLACTGAACSSLSYPDPAEAPGDATGTVQTHVAPPHDPQAWVDLSAAGRDAMRARDQAAAEEAYVAALAETAAFPIHDVRVRAALGNVVHVAEAYQREERWSDAQRLLDLVARNAEAGRLADFRVASPALVRQGDHHRRTGDLDAAVTSYETALALYGATDPAVIDERLDLLWRLGNTCVDVGRPEDAEPHLLAVLRGVQSRRGPDSLAASRVGIDVGEMYRALGDYAAAEQAYARALAIQESAIGGSREYALNQNGLAWVYVEAGRLEDAVQWAKESLARLDAEQMAGPALIATLDTLATAESRLGRVADARAHFARAVSHYDAADPATRARLADLLDHYAEFQRSIGDPGRAEALAARAARERAGATAARD